MDLFKTLIDETKNDFATLMSEGEETNVNRYIDTGSYSFNALLSGSLFGGLAGNRVTALAGEESTGKTFYALGICDSFLETHPTGMIFFFESEHAVDKDLLEARGVDTDRFVLVPIETIQQFRTQALNVIDKYLEQPKEVRDANPILFVLDSLGGLSTNKEIEDIKKGEDKRDMTRAQLIRGCFRAITLRLGRAGIPLIMTNHVYNVIGSYVPMKEMGGGAGLKYAASTIIFLSKKKEKVDNDVVGVIITANLNKSRLTIENKKVETLLNYKSGLNRYYGLVELALKFGVWEKMSTRIVLKDGTKVYEKTINANPEKYFTEVILNEIDKACKQEFLYGETNFADIELPVKEKK